MMNTIYDILGVPFGIILKFIFEAVNNYGLALILFTLFARLLMLPTSIFRLREPLKHSAFSRRYGESTPNIRATSAVSRRRPRLSISVRVTTP